MATETPTARFKAVVAYDGTHYLGYQRQRDGQPTIQAALEQVVSTIAGQPVTVLGSGRTDSGVHALGQVVAFDLRWRHDATTLVRALNASLPADIVVKEVAKVPASFHPRFAARRRIYEYHIANQPLPDPFHRLYRWHVPQPLDMSRMQAAAHGLVGVQDFATFGQPPQGENTVREVFHASWRHAGDDEGHLIFRIEANAFLYRMVRSLVGSLKMVGQGRWSVADFQNALHGAQRRLTGPTAPPHGLFLVAVHYDE